MANVSAKLIRAAAPPPRGRPARISRDAVLDACIGLLQRDPATPISLNAVARELDVTPMAIYTWFANKDELLQALSARLLADFELNIPAKADGYQKITQWAHAMRRHLLKHPQLISMLMWEGGHGSISWIRSALLVYHALAELGLKGKQQARATLWIWQVVMGAVNIEIRNQSIPHVLAEEDFNKLEPASRTPVSALQQLTAQKDYQDTFFAFQLDRMLDALRLMAAKPA